MRRGVAVAGGGLLLAVVGGGVWYTASGDAFSLFKFSRFTPHALTLSQEQTALCEKAKSYWQARLQGDLNTAFSHEDPVRQKALGQRIYRQRIDSGLDWKQVDILDCKIFSGGELADVKLKVHYQAPIAGKIIPVTTQITDHWQKLDGSWRHVLDLALLSTGKRPIIPGTDPQGEPPTAVKE